MSRPARAVTSLMVLVIVLALVGAAAWWGLGMARSKGVLGPIQVPEEYRQVLIDAAAECPKVPVEILAAQIANESGWDPRAVSGAGAKGIAQFMPGVWKQYGVDANADGKSSVWDPVDAIHGAARLNCMNRRLVKDAAGDRLENMLAAYNAGYSAVLKYDGIPPYPETQEYVRRILEDAASIQLD